MDRERTRRAVLGAVLGGGVAGSFLPAVRTYLDRFAPFSGSVWDTARDQLPDTVESPYGPATLRYDDEGVPHVSADDERALYFAAGFAQGADRLFQMDLQRRQMRGQLAEVVGEVALPSDRFRVGMDFAGAAEATWNRLDGSPLADLVVAYTEGVNRNLPGTPGPDRLPMEFDLLDFEPDPWTPADAMLAEKQIGWQLTGSFRTLRKASLEAETDPETAATLFPDRMDHDAQILGHDYPAGIDGPDFGSSASGVSPSPTTTDSRPLHPDLESWLAANEPPGWVGSNSWVVSGEHTAAGAPVMANDPHLSLMAPPVWYEMHLDGPETHSRGVTFPGVPFVVIGENEGGAWGFTNAGADVIDFYTYEARNGGTEYRYGDEWREFDVEERTIAVSDGPDRTVDVKKTVHGPVLGIEADGDELRTEVGVAWTGLAATRTTEAVYGLNTSSGLADVQDALRKFDLPTQNCVYASRAGDTLYRVTGKVPIRRTYGGAVPGNRVFDGSAREGEWPGYTPYGETDWEGDGFVAYEDMPHAVNPPYIGTANQRIVNDDAIDYYFAEAYSAPFRGQRLWERLDERIAGDEPVDPAFMEAVQRDAYDERAALFVPTMLDARDAVSGDAAALLDDLEGWDYRMVTDSRAALVFARFTDHYADVVFQSRLESALGDRRDSEEYYGNDWVLLTLSPDSAWFPEGRDAAIAAALDRTATELAEEGWETYGDYNTTAIDHPFDRSWLNYPRYPTDGSPASLNNFRKEDDAGSSWRMVCPMDKSAATSTAAFPGGNDGSPFSDHYSDQLRTWADGEFKPMPLTAPERSPTVRFEASGGGDG
jgi:penicillin amidase